MEFTLSGEQEEISELPKLQGMTICAPDQVELGEENASSITDGEVTIVYADQNGEEQTMAVSLAQTVAKSGALYRMARAAEASVTTEPDGSLVLDFGTQIAVKRVLIQEISFSALAGASFKVPVWFKNSSAPSTRVPSDA